MPLHVDERPGMFSCTPLILAHGPSPVSARVVRLYIATFMRRFRLHVLVQAGVLALSYLVPLRVEGQAVDGEPTAVNYQVAALRLSLDPRLIPPPPQESRPLDSRFAVRWPADPAVGGLLGGVIGCAAGYVLFWATTDREKTGNDPGWGCIIGGVVGMGAGSGWRIPSEARKRSR